LKIAATHEFLEAVANDEAVHKWVSEDDKPISLASIWPQCIGIEFDTGGFVFQKIGPNCYEVHTLFLPKSRDVLSKARAAAHFMFCATDCTELVTKVPVFNVAAKRLTEKMWFTRDFVRASAFAGNDVEYFRLPLKQWLFAEKNLASVGEEFHKRLGEPDHGQDTAHDQAVGYALCAGRFGLTDKAQHFYNEWALFAGYEPAIRKDNNAFSIGSVEIRFADGEYLICQ
jgi:hypothetical protein